MAKLPPRVVGRKSKSATKKSAKKDTDVDASRDADDQPPVERTAAARNFGISMMGFGALAMILPLFGLQLRQLGNNGALTPIVGAILLVIGGISFAVSLSKTSANLATLGVKIIMWGIIAFMVLILVVGGLLVISAR